MPNSLLFHYCMSTVFAVTGAFCMKSLDNTNAALTTQLAQDHDVETLQVRDTDGGMYSCNDKNHNDNRSSGTQPEFCACSFPTSCMYLKVCSSRSY